MKIATWNVNSLRVRLPHVIDWLAAESPDIFALQETKVQDKDFPVAEFAALGYHALYSGQSAYNGVALLSRTPLSAPLTDPFPWLDEQRRIFAATWNDIRIFNIYVPNGTAVGTDKYDYKLRWLEAMHAVITEELKRYPKLVILGDFNIAPCDADVHDPVLWAGQVLVSDLERAALQRFFDLGLIDIFRQFPQEERSFSWWDYRAMAFRRNMGLRIDLILASPALAATCTSVCIDKVPRGLERPSDHTPVVAEFSV